MLEDMELNPERIPLYKLILHVLQIVLSFVCWCLEIAVFRSKDASVNGQNGWTFGVCFLSIPAWIYLIGAPRFPRTRRFAQPHAMVVVDALFFVIWLSAFASQAAYNTAGKCGEGCSKSKAIVALGVFITLFFGVTTFISLYTLKYYQLNNHLPGYDRLGANKTAQNIDPDMAAFSTAPLGEDTYSRLHDMDSDPYEHDHEHDHDHSPSRVGGRSDYNSDVGAYGSHLDTGYAGASAVESSVGGSALGGGSSVSGLSNPYDDSHALRPAASTATFNSAAGNSSYLPSTVHNAYDDGRPVRFPEADYDRH